VELVTSVETGEREEKSGRSEKVERCKGFRVDEDGVIENAVRFAMNSHICED
jgi:hypothetical protein